MKKIHLTPDTPRRQSRRAFIERGLSAFGIVGSIAHATAAQESTAAPPRKRRPFGETWINQFVRDLNCDSYRELFGSKAQQDLKRFVRTNFILRSEQDQVLNDPPAAHARQIQAFLKRTIEKGTRFKVTITYGGPPRSIPTGDLFIRLPAPANRTDPKKGITFTPVEPGCEI